MMCRERWKNKNIMYTQFKKILISLLDIYSTIFKFNKWLFCLHMSGRVENRFTFSIQHKSKSLFWPSLWTKYRGWKTILGGLILVRIYYRYRLNKLVREGAMVYGWMVWSGCLGWRSWEKILFGFVVLLLSCFGCLVQSVATTWLRYDKTSSYKENTKVKVTHIKT